jgi:hypothetical protein
VTSNAASTLGAPSAESAPVPSTENVAAPSASASADAPSAEPPFPTITPRPALASRAEVERAEISCYETDPEDCGRVATAYDAGVLVPRDRARAEKLRKVEFTRLTRRCEQRSPHACFVLACRSHVGDGVAKDERRANALLQHARELCHRMTTPECVDGEPR